MKEGNKMSQLGEIPVDWEVMRISDYLVEHRGGAALRPKDFVDREGFSVIPKKAITSGGKLKLGDKRTYCTDKFASENSKNIIDKNYIVTTLRDLVPSGPSIGYMVQFDFEDKFILAQGVYGFKIKDNLDKEFLIQYSNTNSFRKVMQTIMVGSTQVHIRNGDYWNVQIPVPPIKEQQKIAKILSTVDEKIAVIDEQLQATQTLKKGLMQRLLTKGIGHTAFKDSVLGEIPVGWEVELLDKCTIRGSGHTPNKQFAEYYNGGIKWISLADSKKLDDRFIDETKTEISKEGLKYSSAVLHQRGSVLLSRDAGIGKSAVMRIDMAVSQHFIVWRCMENLNNWFLYYLLQHFKPIFERVAIGSTIKTIGLGFFKKMKIPLPPINEQEKISRILYKVDDKIDILKDKKSHYQTLKKGLMQKLLTGKIRVKIND